MVSIIIPTFNRAHLIGSTLRSISQQTYTDWECVVVDDGSTDDTAFVVQEYTSSDSRFKYFVRPDSMKKGANASRNYGYQKSSGAFVMWFDSDDIMHPEKIETQMKLLQSDASLDFCFDRFDNFSGDNYQIADPEHAFDRNLEFTPTLENYLAAKVFWGTINVLGKRELFSKSIFKDGLKSGQEYYFFVSVLLENRGSRGAFINRTLCFRRIHSASIQQIQKGDRNLRLDNKFRVYWTVYQDFFIKLEPSEVKVLVRLFVLFYHKSLLIGRKIIPVPKVVNEIFRNFAIGNALSVSFWLLMAWFFRVGDQKAVTSLKKNLN